jgi:hypothetical protein
MKTDELVKTEPKSAFEVASFDLSSGLPNLATANEMPIDLCGNYWTPEEPNETKRMFFVEIKSQKVLSANGNGEVIDLDCAAFLEQKADGTIQTVTNGSRRLVGVLEQYIEAGAIQQGTPLQITFNGKRKNKTNNFSSDSWSIRPLIIKI